MATTQELKHSSSPFLCLLFEMSEFEQEDQYEEEYDYEEYNDEEQYDGEYMMEGDAQDLIQDTSCSSNSADRVATSSEGSATKKHRVTSGGSYEIIDVSGVGKVLKSFVSDLASLLDIDECAAEYLLHFYNWDKEKIIECYFNDPVKVNKDCGLDLFVPNQVVARQAGRANLKFTCKICYDELDNLQLEGFGLGCNHYFCTSCFKHYLINLVKEGPHCVTAHCPMHKCKQAVTKDIFRHFLSPSELDTYTRYVSRRFIECSKTLRYCPAPNCERVALVSSAAGSQLNICCDCRFQYCFGCGEEEHQPSSCEQVSLWNVKCNSDGESAKWIFANTKKCPKCATRIEKNQGCNHMTCRQCKHEFCWICMGNWIGHTTCNKFNSEAADKELSAIQRAKAELDRYLHFYKRYQAHDMSLRFAAKDRQAAETRMRERQSKKSDAWIDVQFIQEAVEQVIQCRRVLKYSYVVGYYLPDNSPEKQLFDRHQEMLEENTEKLHEMTEKNAIKSERAVVVNLTRITEKFRNSIIENFMDGRMLDTASAVGGGSSGGSSASAAPATAAAPRTSPASSRKKSWFG